MVNRQSRKQIRKFQLPTCCRHFTETTMSMPTLNRHCRLRSDRVPKGVCCLRIRSLLVPESVGVGEGVRLSCLFDPENEELYSVKWYKDEAEFFRFLPREKPVYQSFDIGDVTVDMSRSSNGTVYLVHAQRSAEGTYRCEVSADAPSFQSISSEKYMIVEDPPVATSSFAQSYQWTSSFCLRTVALIVLTGFFCG